MTNPTNNPTVTIAIPAYNEANDIEAVILSFLHQQYPDLEEILIADGGSTDGSQNIVKQIAENNPQVKLIYNPNKTQSYALNLMLEKAKGDIFLRADAHSEYANDYIEKCVKNLINTQALNVGGSQRFIAKNNFQSGVALASKSYLGNGNARYRDSQYTGYADTVYLGCFWRETLVKMRGYDVEATPNEDAELNLRLLKKQEQAVYINSDIRAWYTPRSTPKALWIQYFKYGRARFLTSSKHPNKAPIRTKIPFLFSILLLSIFLIISISSNILYGLILILLIAIIFLIESMRVTLKYKEKFNQEIWRGKQTEKPNLFNRIWNCWLALIIMPIAYVSGNCYQFFRNKVLKKQGW
ncbi:glycosyltransferase family 2 protein [Dactylococcopsis salina]|uniref:Glycosyl transferase n=1 Tax=Dactylococcopsis salina (strain PCC 8305) TaxID=13035 RepID=K9YQ78_DACS8|nr:glycosyltransferase family 2 protein [Dactylococcopsis salina]AFZ49081.1 glycosyl transferase [Dactylococcopsis salina PCC 8305]